MIDSLSHQAGAGPDLRKARRRTLDRPDKLPPHDEVAEQGVLGCVLIEPAGLQEALDKFGTDEVFYDLRHQTIWHTLVYLHSREIAIDIISVQAELKNRQRLEPVGGIPYLSALEDSVPSAANLPTYIAIVWEKYLWRRFIQDRSTQTELVQNNGGAAEEFVARVDQSHNEWKALLDRGQLTPKHLKPPNEFFDQYMARWFDRKEDTYGYALPFEFPLRLRPKCSTLMTGDNGSGKTTMLMYIASKVATQLDVDAGEKLVLASMEMPPEATLYTMARQLLNVGPLVSTEENQALVRGALAWLNSRVLLYDFLGITDRHELMNAFEYAVQHQHAKFFILDNLMKVGIADDDYAGQGFFVQRFHDFHMRHATHGILVVHENKGDGNAKQKVRGSKQITDAPNNVIGMKRNEDKKLKLDELNAEIDATDPKRTDILKELETKRTKLNLEADAWFSLYKQRWEDTQQNARARLYYARGMRFTKTLNEPTYPMITTPKPKTQNTE